MSPPYPSPRFLYCALGALVFANASAGCSDSAKDGKEAGSIGGSTSSGTSTGGSSATGGAGTTSGGSGSHSSGVGGNSAATGGTSSVAATGGVGNPTGGAKATGGASSATTTAKSGTGGVMVGTGGKSSATGGKSSSTGGATSAATGGKSSSTGGTTGAATGGGSSTTDGALRWVGRVEPIDATSAQFAWQGAGLVANVTGSTIAVKLRTEGTSTVYFQPVVDHDALPRFKVDEGADRTVTIATGLSSGEHLLELYRETEGYYGISTFLGFTGGTVTGAPASNGRLLEVVGDSISAGYGNLGSEPHPNWVASPACHWTAENSSWYATYAAVAGHALGAEVSTIARSGAGMVRDNEDDRNNVLPNMYANALGTADTTPWSFASKASAVVINLGTNDWANGNPGTSYETAYVQFIATVRGKYPDAWIFLVIGSMVDEPQLTEIKTRLASVVSKVQSSTGDTKLATFDLGVQDMGSDGSIPTGCDWHPNVADHKRMAGILQGQLTAKLGW
jgi:lysophospholipase L1-like esterase